MRWLVGSGQPEKVPRRNALVVELRRTVVDDLGGSSHGSDKPEPTQAGPVTLIHCYPTSTLTLIPSSLLALLDSTTVLFSSLSLICYPLVFPVASFAMSGRPTAPPAQPPSPPTSSVVSPKSRTRALGPPRSHLPGRTSTPSSPSLDPDWLRRTMVDPTFGEMGARYQPEDLVRLHVWERS